MKKKFTEEQYKKIIIAYDELLLQEDVDFGLLDGGSNASKNLYELLEEDTCDFLAITNSYEATIAIANPLTREWAYDKFVEKEKRYVWKYKKLDSDDNTYSLNNVNGIIKLTHRKHFEYDPKNFTEKEIIEAGYNPDMFVKEEPLPF